jgi:threonine dehydrogenase-like Zn-dependent dehydrogenase
MGDGVDGFELGALVACGAGISCGKCPPCRSGATNRCDCYVTVGLERNGALAELAAVPASICQEVGSMGLSPDTAALAQPMAIGVHAVRRGRPSNGERALIVGAGGIGAFLACARANCKAGGRLVVVGLQGNPVEVDFRSLALDEVEIIGTNAHRFDDDFGLALDLLAARSEGWADVAPAILPLDGLVLDGIVPIAEGRSSRIKTLISPKVETTRRFE